GRQPDVARCTCVKELVVRARRARRIAESVLRKRERGVKRSKLGKRIKCLQVRPWLSMGEEGGLTRVDSGRGRVRDHRRGGKSYGSAKFQHFHVLFTFRLVLEITLDEVIEGDARCFPFHAQVSSFFEPLARDTG